MLAAFTFCLLLSGKRFEGSCCLEKTRTPRMCANLCPVAGKSQTPCVWALSSPQQASCEQACFPREAQRGQGDASEEVGKVASWYPLARTLVLALPPHAPPVVFLPCK